MDDLSRHNLVNLQLQIGNEPQIHKDIDTAALRGACDRAGFVYDSGDAGDGDRWFGHMIDAHTARDSEWPRRAHDLLEYWNGEGPEQHHEPRLVPAIAGEPIRPDQAGYVESDFYAYFATCAVLGAGANLHSQTGKFGQPPTADELRCVVAASRGLLVFPDDAPLGAYRRIPEKIDPNGPDDDPNNYWTLRTYVVGPFMVRIRPKRHEAYEPGWAMLDDFGICWRR